MFLQAESLTGVGFLCHIDVGLTSDVHWVANVYYVFFAHPSYCGRDEFKRTLL